MVTMHHLILVDAGVKVSETYYHNTMLLQQFLPAIYTSPIGRFHLSAGLCMGAYDTPGNHLSCL